MSAPEHSLEVRLGATAFLTRLLLLSACALLLPLASACRNQPAKADVVDLQPQLTDDRISFASASPASFTMPDGTRRPINSLLNVPNRMTYGDFIWKDQGVPAGKLWIVVDVGGQTISAFRGGHEIGTSVMLYGADEKPTPFGRFTILQRAKDYWSRSYDAPMPYMLRLTGDGVAIHGSTVIEGSATHGCLGVPIDFAHKLFDAARVGDEVVVLQDARSRFSSPAPVS